MFLAFVFLTQLFCLGGVTRHGMPFLCTSAMAFYLRTFILGSNHVMASKEQKNIKEFKDFKFYRRITILFKKRIM